jgi:hypothetical protein
LKSTGISISTDSSSDHHNCREFRPVMFWYLPIGG